MGDFVEDEKLHPSPAARRGANDDRVMAAAGALELYRQRGHHPHRHKPRRTGEYVPARPWEGEAPEARPKVQTVFVTTDGVKLDRDGQPIGKRRFQRPRVEV